MGYEYYGNLTSICYKDHTEILRRNWKKLSFLSSLGLLSRRLLFLLFFGGATLVANPRALPRPLPRCFLFFLFFVLLRGFGFCFGLLASCFLATISFRLLFFILILFFAVLLYFFLLLFIRLRLGRALGGFVFGSGLILIAPASFFVLLGDLSSL